MSSGFNIGDRHIGDGSPCLIVAEVGQAHQGSLGQAHAYIDAIANAGADAVKFQCHIAAAESTPDEPWRVVPEWSQDENRYAYWKRMEFTPEQWWSLKVHAEDKGLIFLCSPFSVEAVRLLDPLVKAWKVPSGEIANQSLLRAVMHTRKPALISTGMATEAEIQGAANLWCGTGVNHLLMQCTSAYPATAEHVGLANMEGLSEGWRYPVGLSDHSGTIWPSLAAVTLGASIVEVHVCFSKAEDGFDVSSSITIEDLSRLVEGVRFIEVAKTPVDKDALARELEPMRRLFMDRHKRHSDTLAVCDDLCG